MESKQPGDSTQPQYLIFERIEFPKDYPCCPVHGEIAVNDAVTGDCTPGSALEECLHRQANARDLERMYFDDDDE